MRCNEVEDILISSAKQTLEVQAHLSTCPHCAELEGDWKRLRAGFALLASDQGPQPTWGFAERVKNRLADVSEQGQRWEEFLERAGRRVIYATLVVTLMILLGLVLPSSGPLRGPSHPAVLFAQPETTVSQEPILGVGATETISYSTGAFAGDNQQR